MITSKQHHLHHPHTLILLITFQLKLAKPHTHKAVGIQKLKTSKSTSRLLLNESKKKTKDYNIQVSS